MTVATQKFGIPNIELNCERGKINPAAFAGHELIVLFCPADPGRAARELESYRENAREFVAHDAWILAFGEQSEPAAMKSDRAVMIADADERAWKAFRDLSTLAGTADRSEGATFFFRRGGGLQRSWAGVGHVRDILEELREPSSTRKHHSDREGDERAP